MRGDITISKVLPGGGDDYVSIEIRDKESAIRFVSLRLSLVEYANAITGLGRVEGEMDVRGLEHVGKSFEHKTEKIFLEGSNYKRPDKEQMQAHVEQYEVDGWKCNHYYGSQDSVRHVDGGRMVKCGFTRYVEPESLPTHLT